MSKERVGNKSSDSQSLLEADAGLDQTVSEGSIVVLQVPGPSPIQSYLTVGNKSLGIRSI